MMNLSRALLALCLPLTLTNIAPAQTAAAPPANADAPSAEDGAPQLRKLNSRKFATGTVMLELDGKMHEFVTTTETMQAPKGKKLENEAAQKFLESMAGKKIDSAVIRSMAGSLYVTLDAYGNIGEYGPGLGKERTSVQLNFALDPKTLTLKEGMREITYDAPGTKIMEGIKAKDYELTLDSVTKLKDGSLAMKGTFSGTLDETAKGEPLEKPLKVSGTFDMQQVSGNDQVSKLLLGN